MSTRIRFISRLFRLASRTDFEPLAAKATRLVVEVSALEKRLGVILDDAYGEAPVIRIHHGAPPTLH